MDTKPINDEFRADNQELRDCIKALIELSDSGSLAPHGIGGHARNMLAACYHRLPHRKPKLRVRIRPLFAWYDLWIGVFWDATRRKLYVLPLPCMGVVIEFHRENVEVHTSATGSEASTQVEGCSYAGKSNSERVADCGATPCSASCF